LIGTHCEYLKSDSSGDSAVVLAAVLGSVIPVAVVGLVVALLVVGLVVWWARWRREKEDEWEVDMEELEMAEELGTGEFGTVHKAVWKGTDVAAKMMISSSPAATKELELSFKEEVRLSVLRELCADLTVGA